MTIVMTPTGTPPTETPTALAILVRGRGCWLWIVPRCPLCRKRHQHGGGHFDDDPRALLGHRVGHCWKPQFLDAARRGYDLVEDVAGR